MNFLKISGLVMGAGTVAAGTGIYYSVNRNSKKTSNNIEIETATKKPSFDSVENILIDNKDSLDDVNDVQVNSDSESPQEKMHPPKSDKITQFNGKILFYKNTETNNKTTYVAKLINTTQYETQKDSLNKFNDGNEKIIDISGNLDAVNARKKLKEIASKSSSISEIKENIISEEIELKKLLGTLIYEDLKSKLNI